MNDAISAIVTVNTLAGTIGAGFAGVQAARLFGDAAVGVVSVLLTILLLVLSEIAPKTFAATHSATLAPYVGHTLFYLIKIMTPVLMLTRAVTDRLSPDGPENLTRRELAAIIVQAPEEGAISGPEAELLSSMVYAHNVTLKGKRIGIPT
ncbi:MAG: CNNM domain-containing protein [Hyphomicrobiales bacterium]|nr:CNNM domain-containing protein [Hyphomicrobiales bacterium]